MQYQIQGQPYPVVVLTVEPEETVLCQKGGYGMDDPQHGDADQGRRTGQDVQPCVHR